MKKDGLHNPAVIDSYRIAGPERTIYATLCEAASLDGVECNCSFRDIEIYGHTCTWSALLTLARIIREENNNFEKTMADIAREQAYHIAYADWDDPVRRQWEELWQYEAGEGDTRLGLQDWIAVQLENAWHEAMDTRLDPKNFDPETGEVIAWEF